MSPYPAAVLPGSVPFLVMTSLCSIAHQWEPMSARKSASGLFSLSFDASVAAGTANLDACLRGAACKVTPAPYTATTTTPLTDTTKVLLVSSTEKLLSTFTAMLLPLKTAGTEAVPRNASILEALTA